MPSRTFGTLRRTFMQTLVVTGLCAGPLLAQAKDDYPKQPIVLVNPYAAGGSADLLARALAKEMGERLGQPVVVENKGGGGSSIGAAQVAKAAPDGYSLLLGTAASHTVTPLATKVPYEGVNGFSFIGMVATVPNVLVVNPSLPVNTLQELIDLAKAKPGELNYVSAGMGTSPHIGTEMLKHAVGIDLQHVPYKGSAPAANDLVAGMVPVGFLNVSVLLPFIHSDRVRAVAFGGKQRSPDLPDVPTFDEAGLTGFESGSWYSLAAPAGTPAAVIDKLSDTLQEVMESAEFQKILQMQNAVPMTQRKAQATAFVQEDAQQMATLIQKTGLRLQD